VARGRKDFDDVLRPLQQKLAIGLMLLTTFLALPILDFGAISTRDQLARLESGVVKPEKFDWAALAFDFGPDGRAALRQLETSSQPNVADAAKVALAAEDRWELTDRGDDVAQVLRPIEKMVRVLPAGRSLTPDAYAAIRDVGLCQRGSCIAQWMEDGRIALIGRYNDGTPMQVYWLELDDESKKWITRFGSEPVLRDIPDEKRIDMNRGGVTTRKVTLDQLVVDGVPVGPPYVPPVAKPAPRP